MHREAFKQRFQSVIFLFLLWVSNIFSQVDTLATKTPGESELGLSPFSAAFYSPSLMLHHTSQAPDSSSAANIIWKPFDLPTVAVQTLGGSAFAAGVFALILSGSDASGEGEGFAILGATVLGIFALPTGMYLTGNWMGGNGGYWSTLGGCVLGGGVAVLPIAIAGHSDTGGQVLVLLAALAGGIAGYNLSASPVYKANESASFDLRTVPMLARGSYSMNTGFDHSSVQVTIFSMRF